MDTEAWPRKEKVSAIICSTGMMEKAPIQRSCIDTILSINFYYLCELDVAYFSLAANFQPIYPVSDTFCGVGQTLNLTICKSAGVDSRK